MTVVHGWRFPDDLDVPGEDDGDWYRIQYGDNTVYGLSWPAHVDLLHQRGDVSIETEVVDSGVDDSGLRYAAVKATAVVDGHRFSSLQGADEASNQVRDPEYVWAVAESRALKRAVKKALNIKPVDEGTTQATDEEAASSESGGSVDVDPETGDVDVEPPPEYEPDPSPSTDPVETEDDIDW